MNKVLSILVFSLAMLAQIGFTKGACNYFNYGPGQDQGVSVQRIGSTYTVLFGEIPRTTYMGLGFFRRNMANNVFNRCVNNDPNKIGKTNDQNYMHSGVCPSTVTMADLLDHDNVELHYSFGSQSITWQSDSYVSKEMDSVFVNGQFNGTMMSSGYKFQFMFGNDNAVGIDIESILDPELYMFLVPRQLAIGNWSSWNVNKIFANGQEIVAFQIGNMTMSDDICESFGVYLGSSRWDVYNNWRHARYAALMITCVIVTCIVYLNSNNKLLNDRLFSIGLSLFFGIMYSSAGFYFIMVSMEFQGIEYLYYMAIPILYFASFVVYMLKKIFEEMNASFFIRAVKANDSIDSNIGTQKINLRDLKANTLARDIDRNNALDNLRRCIPRQFTNVMIIWAIVILCSPFIEIIYFDARRIEPYTGFVTSVTIAKFISPVASSLSVAIIVFLWSIIEFGRKRRMTNQVNNGNGEPTIDVKNEEHVFTGADFEKNRQSIKLTMADLSSLNNEIKLSDNQLHVTEFENVISRETTVGSIIIEIPKADNEATNKVVRKTNVIKEYFSSFEDPTLRRIEFAICLMICLPAAVATFVIGNLDVVIPQYIYGRRIILLTFHGISWIIFDVSFQLVVTGMVSMMWHRLTKTKTSTAMDTTESIVTDTNKGRKLSRREMTLKVLMSIDEPRSVVEHFCKVTNNYTFFGLLNWLEQIMSAKSEQNNKLGLFFKMYASPERGSVYDEYYREARRRGLLDTDLMIDTTLMEALDQEKTMMILQDLHGITEKYLMTRIIFDGFFETTGYENCLIDYYDLIKKFKDDRIKEQNAEVDQELEDRKRSDDIDAMIREDREGKYIGDDGLVVRDTIEDAEDVLSSMDHVSVDDDVMYDHSE